MTLRTALLVLLLATPMAAQEAFDTPDPLDEDYVTGVAVGERIPSFRLPDLNGKLWDLDTIRGPKGALLLFFRSADW